MDYQSYKEVYFHVYCPSCKHVKIKNTEEPCNECLSNPTNLNSHKPVKYEKKETKRSNERGTLQTTTRTN